LIIVNAIVVAIPVVMTGTTTTTATATATATALVTAVNRVAVICATSNCLLRLSIANLCSSSAIFANKFAVLAALKLFIVFIKFFDFFWVFKDFYTKEIGHLT